MIKFATLKIKEKSTKNTSKNVKNVADSYKQRRYGEQKRQRPHVRYNPDTLNSQYDEIELG